MHHSRGRWQYADMHESFSYMQCFKQNQIGSTSANKKLLRVKTLENHPPTPDASMGGSAVGAKNVEVAASVDTGGCAIGARLVDQGGARG